MDIERILTLKVRKHWRRRARNDLFVMLENMSGYYLIDDISSGGLSYHYIGNGARHIKGTYWFKVVAKDQSVSLSLMGRTVGDSETGSIISQNRVIKRRSIRFEHINSRQKKILKQIIKTHTGSQSPF